MSKFNKNYNSQIVSSDELKKFSRHFVDEFLKKVKIYPPLVVDLSFYPTQGDYQTALKRSDTDPIYSEQSESRLTIHLCEELLKGITFSAFQGWIDYELSCCLLKLQPELYQFNFSRQVLPLFPVTGSAVNLVRHMVEYLRSGLKNYLVTKMIIEMSHGLSQAHFYFFKIEPRLEERYNYKQIILHKWIRASFLCRKLKELIPISLLANRNIGFSRNLKSIWWNYHEYLLPEDRKFLEELVLIPDQYDKNPYSFKLLEMFKKLQSSFFARQNRTLESIVLH